MAIDLILAKLSRLISAPTVAGDSNVALVDDLASQLEQRGAVVTVSPSGRADGLNLHAVLGPVDVEGGVMLCAHTDVVPVAGQPWTREPFSMSVEGGRAYGRGTTDMKGFIAVALTALGELDS